MAAAQKLLAEAGDKYGFEVDLARPNTAKNQRRTDLPGRAAMWARIGAKAQLRTQLLVTCFPMIQRYEAGLGGLTFDAMYSLQPMCVR